MKLDLRTISAGAGATSVFIGGLIGFPFEPLADLAISSALAIATGAGLFTLWPSPQQAKREKILDDLITATAKQAGIDPKEVVEAISTANAKLAMIRNHASSIRAPNTTRRIKKICEIGDKIVEDFRADPKDVRVARAWIGTYLDQTVDLVKAYATLSRTGARNIEAQKQMASFDEMLDLIEDKFQELLDTLLKNDVMDFDVNVTVMRNMLKNEGIAN